VKYYRLQNVVGCKDHQEGDQWLIWVAMLFLEVHDKLGGYLTYLPFCLASLELYKLFLAVQDKHINVDIM